MGLVLPSPPAVMCHVCVWRVGAAGAGQLGCAADGCCLHGLRRWVHCNLLRASGTGILLLAAGSLLMPQWSTTPIAVLPWRPKFTVLTGNVSCCLYWSRDH